MTPTTLADFYMNLGNISITGVNRKFDYPPTALASPDLPAKWVQTPSAEEGPMTFGTHGGWPTLAGQLVIATASFSEGIQSQNYANVLAMSDAVLTALRSVDVTALNLGKARLTWTVSVGQVTVGGNPYWAVIADIQGAG